MSVIHLRRAAACRAGEVGEVSLRRELCRSALGILEPNPSHLRHCAEDILRPSVDLNLIRVGEELFTNDDEFEIAIAVKMAREFLGQARLQVGKISDYGIPLDTAGLLPWISDSSEAKELRDRFGLPGPAIDVFWVQAFAGPTIGSAPLGGACSEIDGSPAACVVALEATIPMTAQVLAHEIGHVLGLFHVAATHNLMHGTVPNGGLLNAEQASRIGDHCAVEWICPQSASV